MNRSSASAIKSVRVSLTKLLCLVRILGLSCTTEGQVSGVASPKADWHQSNRASTDQFRLLTEGKQVFLSSTSKPLEKIPIPREWLVPPVEEKQEEEDEWPISSFLYDTHVTSFDIGNGEIGLQFSSYYIHPEGSINLGVGRDVFWLFNPADASLHPGLITLGITKERDWEGGCFHALMNHFVIGDVNGDGLTDIGIVKEEIQCPGEDDNWFGARYLQHTLHWLFFSADGWKPGETGDTERYFELPLIGMSLSPVEFAAAINQAHLRSREMVFPACIHTVLSQENDRERSPLAQNAKPQTCDAEVRTFAQQSNRQELTVICRVARRTGYGVLVGKNSTITSTNAEAYQLFLRIRDFP